MCLLFCFLTSISFVQFARSPHREEVGTFTEEEDEDGTEIKKKKKHDLK